MSSAALVDRNVVFTNVESDIKKAVVMVQGEGHPARPISAGALCATFGEGLVLVRIFPAASHVVVDLHGQQIYQSRIGTGSDRILAASGAVTGNRIAFVYGALRGSPFSGWSSNEHVLVLDADLKREIEVPNPPDKGAHVTNQVQVFNSPALALSSDGKELAVAKGNNLTLWMVP